MHASSPLSHDLSQTVYQSSIDLGSRLISVIKMIANQKYNDALANAQTLKIPELSYLVKVAYELSVIKYVMNTKEKILQAPTQQQLLTNDGLHQISTLVKLKEEMSTFRQLIEATNQNIINLRTGHFYSCTIPAAKMEFKDIRSNLILLSQEIKKWKTGNPCRDSQERQKKNTDTIKYIKDQFALIWQKLVPSQATLFESITKNRTTDEISKIIQEQIVRMTTNYPKEIEKLSQQIGRLKSEQSHKGMLLLEKTQEVESLKKDLQEIQYEKNQELEQMRKQLYEVSKAMQDLQGKVAVTEMENLGLFSHIKDNEFQHESFQRHEQEKEKLMLEIEQLVVKLEQKDAKIEEMEKLSITVKQQFEDLMNQKKDIYSTNLTKLQQEIQLKKEQILKLQIKNNDLQIRLTKQRDSLDQMQKNYLILNEKYNESLQEMDKMINQRDTTGHNRQQSNDDHVETLNQEIHKLQNLLESAHKKIDDFKQQLADAYDVKNHLENLQEELQREIQSVQTEKMDLKEEINELHQQKQSLLIQNQQFVQKIHQLEQELSCMQAQKNYYMTKKVEYKQMEVATILTLEDLVNIEHQLVNLPELRTLLQSSARKVEQLELSLKQSKVKCEEIEEKYRVIYKQTDFSKIQNMDTFCLGEILQNQPDYRFFIREITQQYTNRKIHKSKLLYKLQQHNKTNFHIYIDNHESLLIIIKTIEGWIFGAYSQGAFIPKTSSTKDGFLFSVSDRKMFKTKTRNYRAITYDDFYLIFGNSQIRIKNLEFEVFSNFGISNGYYETKDCSFETLLGQSRSREIKIVTWEAHQLFFY